MSQYPVMLQVQGRRCLVVGGGRIATRKVEGLRSAGAEVTVIAPRINPRIEALDVRVERRPYRWGDVGNGFQLVITATDDPEVNAQVYAEAEAAGVWVNSADDPDHCSFTLPAVHRDGDVTVAIGTDGSSPALAAWLRDRVRDALPGGLAATASQLAAERRAVQAAGESTEGRDWRPRIEELVAATPTVTGTVHLVGAGPGDPELLTLRAARLLAMADVVVHDALADSDVLALVPEHVERIDVGKRPGRPVPQELINDLLIQLASRHRCVVRLKGGDPFLFGRGGEEALALQAASVPFEVVPGITSAIAAPAAAGVPVTQRGVSASVTIVTGHRREGDEDETDWAALARVGGTIVVLMGVSERAAIARKLIAGGLSIDTPVTAVRFGTRPEQEVTRTTLGALGETPIEAPAAIVIGAVAGFDLTATGFLGEFAPLRG
jgi:uroporphyrin-III C-methyltransferase